MDEDLDRGRKDSV